MVRLSHSAVDKYKTCPRSYKLHYIDKLRDKYMWSSLFFGGAIDEALNELLKSKQPSNTEEIKEPSVIFLEKMAKLNYNKTEINLPFSLEVRYYKSDWDADIIDETDIRELTNYLNEFEYENKNPIEVMANLMAFLKVNDFEDMDKIDQMFFNLSCWTSLIQKGRMMIRAYIKHLLPQIEEVISIQQKVELPNDEGDMFIGYEDFKAKLVGKEGVFACDNKTSSRPYKADSVQDSQQLCIYAEFEETDKGAYFVLNKKVRKTNHKTCLKCGAKTIGREKKCKEGGTGKNRCNGEFDVKVVCSIDTQLIADEITEEQKDLTFDSFDDILILIKDGEFDKVDKKKCFLFGRFCPYYTRCFKDAENMDGLVNIRTKDDIKEEK